MKPRLGRNRLLDIIELTYAASEDHTLWEPVLAAIVEATAAAAGAVLSPRVSDARAVLVQYRYALDDLDSHRIVRRDDASRLLTKALDGPDGAGEISLYRSEADPPFGTEEGRFVETLAPHLSRSLRVLNLISHASQQRDVALDALDWVAHGVLLVTADARVVHANRVALSILARRDGLRMDRGRLQAASTELSARLLRSIGRAAGPVGDGADRSEAITLPCVSGARPMQALVCPVGRERRVELRQQETAAVVFLSESNQDVRPDRSLLIAYYGLTPAEADVAARLSAGETVDEIAGSKRYTRQTVQWYVKQVLGKTGCRSRIALVREISSRLASLSVPPR